MVNPKPYLSKYGASLRGLERIRYMDKISKFPKDPYIIVYNEKVLPRNTTYLDIYEYLVNTKSFYSQLEFKSYKALGAYKLFEGGWVQTISGFKISTGYLIFGKVLHSQSLNLAPLKIWVEVCTTGSIETAHCTCVAGCSHVGAILFALNAISQNGRDSMLSVTDVKASWLVPSCKSALQLPNENIIYNSKGRNITKPSCTASISNSRTQIFEKIRCKGEKAVGMLGLDAFLNEEKDLELEYFIQIYMGNLYEKHFEGKSLNELLLQFKDTSFIINSKLVEVVEQNTRFQSKSEYWYKLRLGRITASMFKEVCSSKTENSVPVNLLRRICYPHVNNMQTKPMQYGKNTEQIALKSIIEQNKKRHEKLKISSCGLLILQTKSFYAASPDAIWSCESCGTYPIEIKCPFTFKDFKLSIFMVFLFIARSQRRCLSSESFFKFGCLSSIIGIL